MYFLEQPNQIKCHICNKAAAYAFAYARFNDRETFFGVIYRGVCRECLSKYIESIKNDRRLRGELLLCPAVLLPVGALFAALSDSRIGQAVGFFLLGSAIIIPVVMRLWQRRESLQARSASAAENEARYGEQMCREDALRTSRQTKLVYLRPEYAEAGLERSRIAQEAGVTLETAALIQQLAISTQHFLRAQTNAGGSSGVFDKPDML